MKYYETVKDDKGIFGYLNDIGALPFSEELFPYTDIDLCFTWNNGEGLLTRAIEKEIERTSIEDTYGKVATIIKVKYKQKWQTVFDSFQEEFPLLLSTKETIDEVISDTGIDLNKTSAYDSEEMVSDTETEKNGNKKRTYERQTIRPDLIFRNLERLQDSVIYDTIFSDVKKQIILKIN